MHICVLYGRHDDRSWHEELLVPFDILITKWDRMALIHSAQSPKRSDYYRKKRKLKQSFKDRLRFFISFHCIMVLQKPTK